MEKKYQSQPTHFIEVWRNYNGKISYGEPLEIRCLKTNLLSTEFISATTLVIFKITPRIKN